MVIQGGWMYWRNGPIDAVLDAGIHDDGVDEIWPASGSIVRGFSSGGYVTSACLRSNALRQVRTHAGHRQDSNHAEIRSAFERLGCSVADLSSLGGGCPDLLVGLGGLNICVEIKDGSKPPSKRKLTEDEERFRMNWKGGYRLVENLEHVAQTVEVLKGWHEAIRRIG